MRFVQYDGGFKFDFIKESKGELIINPVENFIVGQTMNKKTIYIFKKDSFPIREGLLHYSTDTYIFGSSIEEKRIAGLRFTGGILANLFMPNKIEIDLDENIYKVKFHDDSVNYQFSANGKDITIHIESLLSEKQGIRGRSLENRETSLEVTVDNGLSLSEIIPLYNAVLKMCQFLTFRKNIEFERIQLLEKDNISEHIVFTEFAQLHTMRTFKNLTAKTWLQCVSFEDLGSAIIPLFKSIYEEKEKKPSFSLDFLPEDEADVYWISPDKIKKICTSLECEAALHKIKAENNQVFKKLIDDVKLMVKQHEAGNSALPPKTYNVIRGSIEHWDFSASDKVKELFHKYEEILIQPGCFRYSFSKFEDAIDAFIKYRNTTTHGNHMNITGELADTAANLMNLIYISRLDRSGMPLPVIKDKICQGVVYR